MRVAAISYGTQGDVRPFVALGLELRRRGHHLVLAVDAAGAPIAAEHGVKCVPLPGDLRGRIAGDGAMARFVRRGSGVLAGIPPVRRLLADHLHGWTTALLDAAPDADVVLASGLSMAAGFNAAEVLDVPVVAAVMQPFAPSRHLGHPLLPPRLPLPFHAPLTHVATAVTWYAFADITNASRVRLGLPRRSRVWSDYPQLGAWSPSLVPPPPDWPGNVTVTGDWPLFTTRPALDDELAAFLADGDAPIHIGFGSMTTPDGLLPTLLRALDGRRAVLAPAWGDRLPPSLPPGVMVIGQTPHDLLFRRVAASVNHCGAGTSHAAVRAGAPVVGIPITADQPFWAEVLHRRGLGTRPLDARRLTVAQARRAFDEAPALRPTVAETAASMAAEDGPARAADVLERLVGR